MRARREGKADAQRITSRLDGGTSDTIDVTQTPPEVIGTGITFKGLIDAPLVDEATVLFCKSGQLKRRSHQLYLGIPIALPPRQLRRVLPS
jgi:hypothetical protein